jgi:predicted Na+-dependent transporter
MGRAGSSLWVPIVAAFSIAALAVGHWLGRPAPEQRRVLALSTASRHPAIAIAIAAANFSEPKPVMGAVVLYLIVSAVVAMPYVARNTGGDAGAGGGVGVRTSATERARPLRRAAI